MEPVIDTTKPHSARVYDYYLGGQDHFAVDRETGRKAMESWPAVRTAVQENRAFLGRAVQYLVGEAGIRQFLDIGTGLPSASNVHEVAQEAAPESRVVYVDNDPVVLAHARTLLTGSPEGRTAYIDADLRDPEKILASPRLIETLDLSQPVALMLVAVLHFLVDADNPAAVVAALLAALPPGSYLVATVGAGDAGRLPDSVWPAAAAEADLAAYFGGLDLLPPGIVRHGDVLCGVGLKPYPRPTRG